MFNPFSALNVYRSWTAHGGGILSQPDRGGIDYSPIPATYVIKACASGTVTQYFTDPYGNSWLTVGTSPGVSYSHLHMKERWVQLGDAVSEGQDLGLAGGGANEIGHGQSTGRHVHWHFTVDGRRVDPAIYVAASPPSPTQNEDEMVRFIAATGSDTYGGRSVGANTWAAIEGGAFTRISSSEELDALADSMGITRAVLESQNKKNVSGRSFLLTESVYIRMNP